MILQIALLLVVCATSFMAGYHSGKIRGLNEAIIRKWGKK